MSKSTEQMIAEIGTDLSSLSVSDPIIVPAAPDASSASEMPGAGEAGEVYHPLESFSEGSHTPPGNTENLVIYESAENPFPPQGPSLAETLGVAGAGSASAVPAVAVPPAPIAPAVAVVPPAPIAPEVPVVPITRPTSFIPPAPIAPTYPSFSLASLPSADRASASRASAASASRPSRDTFGATLEEIQSLPPKARKLLFDSLGSLEEAYQSEDSAIRQAQSKPQKKAEERDGRKEEQKEKEKNVKTEEQSREEQDDRHLWDILATEGSVSLQHQEDQNSVSLQQRREARRARKAHRQSEDLAQLKTKIEVVQLKLGELKGRGITEAEYIHLNAQLEKLSRNIEHYSGEYVVEKIRELNLEINSLVSSRLAHLSGLQRGRDSDRDGRDKDRDGDRDGTDADGPRGLRDYRAELLGRGMASFQSPFRPGASASALYERHAAQASGISRGWDMLPRYNSIQNSIQDDYFSVKRPGRPEPSIADLIRSRESAARHNAPLTREDEETQLAMALSASMASAPASGSDSASAAASGAGSPSKASDTERKEVKEGKEKKEKENKEREAVQKKEGPSPLDLGLCDSETGLGLEPRGRMIRSEPLSDEEMRQLNERLKKLEGKKGSEGKEREERKEKKESERDKEQSPVLQRTQTLPAKPEERLLSEAEKTGSMFKFIIKHPYYLANVSSDEDANRELRNKIMTEIGNYVKDPEKYPHLMDPLNMVIHVAGSFAEKEKRDAIEKERREKREREYQDLSLMMSEADIAVQRSLMDQFSRTRSVR